jgi:hypothetical protein
MSIVIVAIPREDDPVWKYSSEKVPHMTLLYLGDNELRDQENTLQYIQHVAKTSLSTFGMSVSRRGPLGPNDADVLFFTKDWQNKDLVAVRGHLLANDNIKIAHDSAEQFEGWTPHLTMGFPETPAKKDDREYPGFHYVQFDRIAVWFDDYEGPEFLLESNDMLMCEDSSPAAWSDEQEGEEVIEHAGPTVQDILDALTPQERGTFDLILGASVDGIDLSDDAETVAAYNAFSDDQKNVLGFLTGLAVDMDIDDDLIDEDELEEDAENEAELRQSAIADLASDILTHSGVKGMKWGVRNDRSGDGSSTSSPKPPKATKLNKMDSNTRISRKMLRDKVKQGEATIGEAHKAAIKSKGHRVLNFVTGDRKYWVSQLKITGVTAAVIGVAALGTVTGVLPATALGGVAVTALTGAQGAGLVTGVTNAGRAILGNRRINNSYQKLGTHVNDLARKGDDKIKNTLNKQGGIRKKFLEDKKKSDVDNPNVKHSALEDLIGDILDPKELEHSGVKGMKWGVRNDTAGITTLRTGEGGVMVGPGGAAPLRKDVKVTQKTLKEVRTHLLKGSDSPFRPGGEISKITDKYRATGKTDSKTFDAYDRETGVALTKYVNTKLPDGAISHISVRDNDALIAVGSPEIINRWAKDIQHAEDDPFVYRMSLVRDDDGFITEILDGGEVKHSEVYESDNLEHFDDNDLRLVALDEFLMHYGVPGMRWGYRRSTNSSGLVTGKVPKEISDGGPGGSTATPRESADHDRVVTALAKKNEHGVQALSTQELKDINNRIKALDEFEKAMTPKEKSDLQKRVDELKLQRELRQLEGQMKLDQQSAGKTLAKSILANGGKVLADNIAKEMGIFGGRYVDQMLGNTANKAAEKERERAREQAAREREERRQDIREELKQRRKEAREDAREFRKQREREEKERRNSNIRMERGPDGVYRS